MYLSLWARLQNQAMEQIEAALYRDRTLVRIPALHARLYLVPTEDMAAYLYLSRQHTTRSRLDDLDDILCEAGVLALNGVDDPYGDGHSFCREMAQRVLEIMNTRGPMTIEELMRFLPELRQRIPHDPECPERGYELVGTRLIPAMCAEGLLVRARTRGGWRSDLFSYATLASWLPQIDLGNMDGRAALERILGVFVAAYGPVTIGDAQQWLGGYPRREVAATLTYLPNLVHLQIEGNRGDYVLFAEQLEALLNGDEEQPGAALLPPRDTYLTAYSDAHRFVPAPYVGRIYDRVGEPVGTVWLGGQIIGIWWLQFRDERLLIRFFEEQGPEALASVGEEARRLAEFMAFTTPELDIGTFAEKDDELQPTASLFPGSLPR
ncbi:MAG: AlkZ family DNA glycosylase [Chloroflexi bacterium]|nr:AlkZ family DNA glycosylase [Chloroflexota bacterium]